MALVDRLVRSALVPYDIVLGTAVEWLDASEVQPWVGGSQDRTAEAVVRAAVDRQVAREASWGDRPTDVDRLLEAFACLEDHGFAVLEDIGPDLEEGELEARQALIRRPDAVACQGFVFYGLRCLVSAVDRGVLPLGTSGWGFTPEPVVRIALLACLTEHGFSVADPGGSGPVEVELDWCRRGWASGALGPDAVAISTTA